MINSRFWKFSLLACCLAGSNSACLTGTKTLTPSQERRRQENLRIDFATGSYEIYQDCVFRRADTMTTAPAAATEVAEGAIGECVSAYEQLRRANIELLTFRVPRGLQGPRIDQANERSLRQRDDVRRLAIARVIRNRT